MTAPKRIAKTKQYHHGDLRQALIQGALVLIEQEGIAALSLREVARRIGVSHAAPYHHFEDRSALLGAIAEQGFIAMAAKQWSTRCVRPKHNPIERLRCGGRFLREIRRGKPVAISCDVFT